MKAIINGRLIFPHAIRKNVLLVENGRIVGEASEAPNGAEIIDAKGLFVGPGFVDIHCHGYGGFARDTTVHSVVNDPIAAAKAMLRHGTTSMTASAGYHLTRNEFLECIQKCRAAIREGNTTIVGIHFEGPFINPLHGASSHSAWKFSEEACDVIFEAAGEDVLHCTYAPELPFAPAFEKYLSHRGVVLDLGHTRMDAESCERAVKNGARIVTHLFDAMGCCHGNDSVNVTGIIQESADVVALATEGLYYELICDSRGIHVKPANARMALRTAGEDHIILVTDCAGEITHCYTDYPADDPRSAPDLNYNEAAELSGSRLTMDRAVSNFKSFTGADLRVCFKCAATNAATALGLEKKVGSLLPGREANLVFVDENLSLKSVYFRGEKVC